MGRQVTHIALRGGLDIVSSPLFVEPGRIWTCVNYEAVEAGYRRVEGYERVDGRPSPSDANYWILPFDGAVATPPADGATITGGTSSATAVVLKTVGSLYVLSEIDGTFEDDEPLTPGAGVANGTPGRRGADTIDEDFEYLDLAAANRRMPILAVPGVGRVLGVWSYMGVLYAVRDDDTNDPPTSAVMHRATAMGWEAVPEFVLPAGGRYEFRNNNFGGQAATRKMYGVNGVGQAFQWDGTAFTSIGTGHSTDTPTHLSIHSNHLLLGYRGGSLQGSSTGTPTIFDALTGAFEIGCGQEINGLIHAGAGNTLIVGDDRMQVLYGQDSGNIQLADHSDPQTGGVEWTAQSVGAPLFLDNRGVRRFDVTDNYGNFVINTMTSDIQPFLDKQREARNVSVGSMRVRSKDQYRVWFASGIGVCIYLGRGRPEISFLDYGSDENDNLIFPRCSVSVEDADRIERVYFGADNGFVYEAGRGRSFDGRTIPHYIRLPLNHMGRPTQQKRFFRSDIHLDLDSQIKVSVAALFNDGNNPDAIANEATVAGGGGLWDEALWDDFYWDSPLNGFHSFDMPGRGRNASVLIQGESKLEPPHTLNGISIHWSPTARAY